MESNGQAHAGSVGVLDGEVEALVNGEGAGGRLVGLHGLQDHLGDLVLVVAVVEDAAVLDGVVGDGALLALGVELGLAVEHAGGDGLAGLREAAEDARGRGDGLGHDAVALLGGEVAEDGGVFVLEEVLGVGVEHGLEDDVEGLLAGEVETGVYLEVEGVGDGSEGLDEGFFGAVVDGDVGATVLDGEDFDCGVDGI